MKRKLGLMAALAAAAVLAFAACGSDKTPPNGALWKLEEELVTLDSRDAVVDEDGFFTVTGKFRDPQVSLEAGGNFLVPVRDEEGNFSVRVLLREPADSLEFTALGMTDSQTFTMKLDAEKFAAARQETQALEGLVGASLADAKATLSALGYTARYVYETDGSDCADEVSAASEAQLAGWLVEKVKSVDAKGHGVKLVVASPELVVLRERLGAKQAWKAAKAHGKNEYPYGFALHYLIAKELERAKSADTWLLRATCSVTNMYGATAKLTCQAEVTGTSDRPEVVSFKVFQPGKDENN